MMFKSFLFQSSYRRPQILEYTRDEKGEVSSSARNDQVPIQPSQEEISSPRRRRKRKNIIVSNASFEGIQAQLL